MTQGLHLTCYMAENKVLLHRGETHIWSYSFAYGGLLVPRTQGEMKSHRKLQIMFHYSSDHRIAVQIIKGFLCLEAAAKAWDQVSVFFRTWHRSPNHLPLILMGSLWKSGSNHTKTLLPWDIYSFRRITARASASTSHKHCQGFIVFTYLHTQAQHDAEKFPVIHWIKKGLVLKSMRLHFIPNFLLYILLFQDCHA